MRLGCGSGDVSDGGVGDGRRRRSPLAAGLEELVKCLHRRGEARRGEASSLGECIDLPPLGLHALKTRLASGRVLVFDLSASSCRSRAAPIDAPGCPAALEARVSRARLLGAASPARRKKKTDAWRSPPRAFERSSSSNQWCGFSSSHQHPACACNSQPFYLDCRSGLYSGRRRGRVSPPPPSAVAIAAAPPPPSTSSPRRCRRLPPSTQPPSPARYGCQRAAAGPPALRRAVSAPRALSVVPHDAAAHAAAAHATVCGDCGQLFHHIPAGSSP